MIIIKRFTQVPLQSFFIARISYKNKFNGFYKIMTNKIVFSQSNDSSGSDKKSLKSLYTTLVNDASRLNSTTIVRSLHLITFNNDSGKENSVKIKNNEIQYLIEKITNNPLTALSHGDLTLLLESLSQYQKYQAFNKDIGLFRAIVKRLNYIQNMKFECKFAYRLLHMLQKLQFPEATIKKYLQYTNSKTLKNSSLKQVQKIKPVDTIRIFILMIEKKSVPIHIITQFFENVISTTSYKTSLQLSYLYVMLKNVEMKIESKYAYLSQKIQVYDVMFNPYSQVLKENQQSGEYNSQNKDQSNRIHQQKLKEQTNNLIKLIKDKFSIVKIEKDLIRQYAFEYAPLNPSIASMLTNIKELIPRFIDLIKNSSQSMLPHEFIELCNAIPLSSTTQEENKTWLSSTHINYCEKTWNFLDLGDKLLLIEAGHRYLQKSKQPNQYMIINSKRIEELLDQSTKVTSKDFRVLEIMLKKYIDPSEHLSLLEKIEKIVDQNK